MKEGWEIKKLGDCFDSIKNGANIKQERGASGIPITRIETLSGGVFNRDRLGYANILSLEKYVSFVLDDGDLLLSHINSKTYIGRTVVYNKLDDEVIIHGMNLLRLKAIREILSPYYAYYCFKSEQFKDQVASYRKDAVNQSSIPVSDLKKINIPIPPIAEQEKIVAELDCLSGIIEKKKQQLKEYDALAQSIFYEMFGDPVENEKGWEMKKMGDISTIGTGATPSRLKEDLYYGGGIPWVKTTEVQNCDITKTEETITKLAIEETNCKLYPSGTLLMAMYGQGKTRGQIAKLKISATTNQACAAIMLNETICNLEYIYELLFINYDNIRAMAQGGNQANLNLKLVSSIPIILPPLSLQQAFATKIEAIEKQKELIKKSIEEVETLFNSRMEYYFN